MQRIIPLDQIKRNSKVIIYGAGTLGRRFYEQNLTLKWFDVVTVIDTNPEKIKDFPVRVEGVEYFKEEKNFDYILIAIASESKRSEVKNSLLKMGICKEAIIDRLDWYRDESVAEDDMVDDLSEIIRIALLTVGGLGDNIIDLAFYQALIDTTDKVVIDVYTDYFKSPEAIYYGQNHLGMTHCGHIFKGDEVYKTYDLIICIDNDKPRVMRFNEKKISRISESLSEKISLTVKQQKADAVLDSIKNNYRSRINIERARKRGENRYSMLSVEDVFPISGKKANLILNKAFENTINELGLTGPYITFNYGADDVLKDGRVQTKMWPEEYHIMFNRKIKERFPSIEIIQLGGRNSKRIEGADRYIFGNNLESVKYILKNALCHLDCEGGLVHMATQLGTKCFVIFGPTPVWYYGYEQNENFVPEVCTECIFLSWEWYTHCLIDEKPKCVYEIKPDTVMNKMGAYIEECLSK